MAAAALELLGYPAMFADPAMIPGESAWTGHLPFGMALVQMMRPRVLVELGTHRGHSYLGFCQTVKSLGLPTRCHAVDTWQGDAHTGPYAGDILAQLRQHHDPLYSSFSTLMQTDFDSAVGSFAAGQIDLLHIDGLHTYDAVRHDWETWHPKVSDAGVVLFHDTAERQGDFGVWRLWEELSPRYPSFAFEHSHGLGVLGVGKNLAPDVAAFFEHANRRPADVRRLFATLGDRLVTRQGILQMLDPIHQWRGVAEQWRTQTGVKMDAPPVDVRIAMANPVGYTWAAAREAYVVADQDLKLRQAYAQLEAEHRRLKGGTP